MTNQTKIAVALIIGIGKDNEEHFERNAVEPLE